MLGSGSISRNLIRSVLLPVFSAADGGSSVFAVSQEVAKGLVFIHSSSHSAGRLGLEVRADLGLTPSENEDPRLLPAATRRIGIGEGSGETTLSSLLAVSGEDGDVGVSLGLKVISAGGRVASANGGTLVCVVSSWSVPGSVDFDLISFSFLSNASSVSCLVISAIKVLLDLLFLCFDFPVSILF